LLLGISFLRATEPVGAGEPIAGIGPTGPIVKLHTGFEFTEGPAADGDGNVFFSDVPNKKILKVDAEGKLSTFTDESHHANGLMVNADGDLVACEMDGHLAVWTTCTEPKRRVLIEGHGGKRFNAPNDLVLDTNGGIYFTDPHFRAPDPLPQGKTAVYFVAPSGDVKRLVEDLPAPNGIILSPDETTLYVFPSGQPTMRAYPIVAPGKLGEGRDFCKLKVEGDGLQGADGVTIDTKGNLYITSKLGVQVFAPDGQALGIIELPEPPANLTFGGKDMKTLYVTARTSLYTAPMETTGHRFGVGKAAAE
jgi:gluconolactonase